MFQKISGSEKVDGKEGFGGGGRISRLFVENVLSDRTKKKFVEEPFCHKTSSIEKLYG